MNLKARSLCGYGKDILKRDNYICVYCGFDGRSFDNWLQMSIDHLVPVSAGGNDDSNNLVAACKACNSFTSRLKVEPNWTRKKIIAYKKAHITKRREEFLSYWQQHVTPQR